MICIFLFVFNLSSGKMINNKGSEQKFGQIMPNMKGNIQRVKNMGKESSIFRMDLNMKVYYYYLN